MHRKNSLHRVRMRKNKRVLRGIGQGAKFMVVMTGLGMSSELCMIGYSLVLAMNYLPGMAVITLNVIGDAATNVIVSFKEKVLNKDVYYK